MGRDELSFGEALSRLEDIVAEIKQKDVSLEHSLDLLEEGVRLANVCTEQTDHAQWQEAAEGTSEDPAGGGPDPK